MKAYLEKPENPASLKEEIQALKEEHLEDLDRLYAAHAGEYTQEVLDLYYSKDDVFPASDLASQDPDNIEIYEKLDVSCFILLHHRLLFLNTLSVYRRFDEL